MSQSTRERAETRRPHSSRTLCDRIAALTIEALRFVPPTRVAETVHRWLDHPNGAPHERDPTALLAEAMSLATDLVLFAPSASGATAIDRLARRRKAANAEESLAIEALRRAQFRVTRVEAREAAGLVRLRDLISGELLEVVDKQIPTDAVGLRIAVRSGPLGDGRHALIGPITPLDDTACGVALGFRRPDGNGLSNPQRCAEAVYRHVLRHGGIEIRGLNAPSEDDAGPLDPEACDLADIAQDWARLQPDASPPRLDGPARARPHLPR